MADGGGEGPASCHAIWDDSRNSANILHALAVRVSGGDKICNILRFYHDLPRSIHRIVSGWIGTPKTAKLDRHVFAIGSEAGDKAQKSVEARLLEAYRPLNIDQR